GPFTAKAEVAPGEVALFHPDFFPGVDQNYWIPESFYRLTDSDLHGLCAQAGTTSLPVMAWQAADSESFATSLKAILERIHHGPLKKAVPIVFQNSTESITSLMMITMIK